MPNYLVAFSAYGAIEIEADNRHDAETIARHELTSKSIYSQDIEDIDIDDVMEV